MYFGGKYVIWVTGNTLPVDLAARVFFFKKGHSLLKWFLWEPTILQNPVWGVAPYILQDFLQRMLFSAKCLAAARAKHEGSLCSIRANGWACTSLASVPREELVGTRRQVILSDRLLAWAHSPARKLSEPESGKISGAVLNAPLCSSLPLMASTGISLGNQYPGYSFQGTSIAASIARRDMERF